MIEKHLETKKEDKLEMKYKAKYELTPGLKPERKRFETLKDAGHFYFDKIWEQGHLNREEAYEWLAMKLEVSEEKAHFKHLNNQQCYEAIFYCQQVLNDLYYFDKEFGVTPKTHLYILEE